VIIPSPVTLNPQASDLADQIAALSGASGIYALAAEGKPPHLSWSSNLARRLKRLLIPSLTSTVVPLGNMRGRLASIDCWPTGSRLETSLLMTELVRRHYPDDYLRRLRLRMPWFVSLILEDPFPRLAVVNRIPKRRTSLYGPFQSRDLAQKYEQELLGLFQIRRCVESLDPHPEHPGCIYGEMNLCIRPCQCAVSVDEYATEVQRVAEFLSTNGRNAVGALSAARDRACEATDFEQAAQLHKRIEKVTAAAATRDVVIAEAHQLQGIALTRGIGRRQLKLWPMSEGYWQEPLVLDFSMEEAGAKSLDHELRERLKSALSDTTRSGKRLEDLAIFARWYYSSWRDGHWFPFRSLNDLNYRRLVREISNILKTEVLQ
jgi:excinuclease UvrABC nuclease subunit